MKFPFLFSTENESEIINININKIESNPYQPRQGFDQKSIKELAQSINSYGVIQPISIRKTKDSYQIIAGERRLRAVKMLGFKTIPAIIKDLNDHEMAAVALVENLQRKDLTFFEEASAYEKMIKEFDLTQQQLAKKLGKSQSTIANKLRLLKLPDQVRQQIDPRFLTERHARTLLLLDNVTDQLFIIKKIKEEKLTVKETKKLVDKICQGEDKKKADIVTVYKDLRIFKNTINKTIKEMKKAGLAVKVNKETSEDFFQYTILLPRKEEE